MKEEERNFIHFSSISLLKEKSKMDITMTGLWLREKDSERKRKREKERKVVMKSPKLFSLFFVAAFYQQKMCELFTLGMFLLSFDSSFSLLLPLLVLVLSLDQRTILSFHYSFIFFIGSKKEFSKTGKGGKKEKRKGEREIAKRKKERGYKIFSPNRFRKAEKEEESYDLEKEMVK